VSVRILRKGDERALEEFLLPRADASMFLLSNVRTSGIEDRGEPYQGTYAAAIEDGRVVAVAGHVWNRSVLLQAPVRLAEVVRAAVSASGREVGGFVGPFDQTQAARAVLGLEREPVQYANREDRFVLDAAAVRVPDALRERRVVLRLAREADVPLLSRWRVDFAVETLGAEDTEATRATYGGTVARQQRTGLLYVLEEEGRIVSTTAFNAWAPPAAQVGGVYTPPSLRGRGHARAAVAGSVLDAASRGVSRVVLFTGSPAARRAYEAVGFREVGDYGIVLLARPAAPRAAAVEPT
jgi:RimJ/RimL family protein N-acetyltransferase